MTEGVHAVRSQSQGPHPVHLHLEHINQRGAGRRFWRQNHQAIVIRAQAQFIFGA